MTHELSKGRLERIAAGGGFNFVEAEAMARALLAAYEQEPDYIRYSCGCCGYESLSPVSACPKCNFDNIEGTPLFMHPAPSIPAVPDEATPGSIEIMASIYAPRGVTYCWDTDECNAAADAWNACRAAMLQADAGWIPVSERLPEFFYSVLVADEHEDIAIAIPVDLSVGDTCAFRMSNGDIFLATHWQPLPAPPKGV